MSSLIKAYEDGTLAEEQRKAREAEPFPKGMRIDFDTCLDNPPNDGRDWDCQCARCGSSCGWIVCETCGGAGETEPGELYEQDPMWYSPSDTDPCCVCMGAGGWDHCLSSLEWCEATPMPGREKMERGRVEWFCTSKEIQEATP